MKRLILILMLLIALPCLAAPTWQVTVKVEKTPADTSEAKLKVHSAKHDSVQADIWFIIQGARIEWRTVVDSVTNDTTQHTTAVPDTIFPSEVKGWGIIDNANGTHYFMTVPDTIPIIGPIRSALGKYNRRVTVRKEKVEELEEP